MKLRVPTNREYDQLVEMTDGDNSKMHWNQMASWVNDAENEYGLDASSCAICGYVSARYWDWDSSSTRYVDLGFRPACSLPAETLASAQNGECMVMGTLYMGNEPVKVPQNPSCDGDITAYIPGAMLELREALDDPDYQVMGYRVGDAVVADRCLLKLISYEDIEAHALTLDHSVGLSESGIPDIKPSIRLNGQTFSVEEVARALGIQEDIQTVRLCQPCRSGTIFAELELREEELSGIDLALQIPAGDSTEEFLAARCYQRAEGSGVPRAELYGRRGGYIAYGPLDARSEEQVEETPIRDRLVVGGGQYEGVLDLYTEDEAYVDFKGTCPEVTYCHD